ncbi:MAG: twin-arginine translocase TatA/TatE family subunit [Alphaproteobacteria bacterium GM7ARS4]|nr:twin-arginine translocase TatA/TatE family subunit [Alphaproteobacteria bacterium GM7ARS4]
MFDIGGWEVLIILLVALMVVKPRDIPSALASIARGLGRIRYEIDNWQQQMQFSWEQKQERNATKDMPPDDRLDKEQPTQHDRPT